MRGHMSTLLAHMKDAQARQPIAQMHSLLACNRTSKGHHVTCTNPHNGIGIIRCLWLGTVPCYQRCHLQCQHTAVHLSCISQCNTSLCSSAVLLTAITYRSIQSLPSSVMASIQFAAHRWCQGSSCTSNSCHSMTHLNDGIVELEFACWILPYAAFRHQAT